MMSRFATSSDHPQVEAWDDPHGVGAAQFFADVSPDTLTRLNSRDSGFFDICDKVFGLLVVQRVARPMARLFLGRFVQVVQAEPTLRVGSVPLTTKRNISASVRTRTSCVRPRLSTMGWRFTTPLQWSLMALAGYR